jgi:Uma2 family endonuclease
MCATVARYCTPDELLALSNGEAYELVDGSLVEKKMGAESSLIAAELIGILLAFIKTNRLGFLFADGLGYRCFTNSPNEVRKPDISFIRAGRLEEGRFPKGFLPFAPDLAIEILSPGDLATEIDEKVEQFLTAGTSQIWIVNPAMRTVRVHQNGGLVVVLHAEDELTGGNVLPGFSCRVAELFAGLVA